MKSSYSLAIALALGLLLAAAWAVAPGLAQDPAPGVSGETQAPLGSSFTYQGQLRLHGSPVNLACDFQFSLWDSEANPSGQIGATQTISLTVNAGQFTVPELNFGSGAFDGQARWLEIAVRCPTGSGSYTLLQPRQQLNPAPYSLYAAQASNNHDHWGQTWTGSDFGLTLKSTGNFANSAGLVSSAIAQGTGVQGLAVPSNASAGMTVPTGISGISLLPAGGFANRTYGVYGQASGDNAYPIFGLGTYTGTAGIASGANGIGVYGEAMGSGGSGVKGRGANGVYAESTTSNGNGIIATANTGTLAFGVWGISSQGYAGYFSGKVNVTGNLTKGGGAFKIDHPLDPANQYLYHSFVESPDMKNIYDGVVTLDANGEAVVTLPDWFETLNRDFRYQLTCVGGYAPVYIADEIQAGEFRIAGGAPGLKVSWQVTGIRQDPWANDNRIPVEEAKPPAEVGTYIYPQGYALPESYSLDFVRSKSLLEQQALPVQSIATGQDTWVSTNGEIPPLPQSPSDEGGQDHP